MSVAVSVCGGCLAGNQIVYCPPPPHTPPTPHLCLCRAACWDCCLALNDCMYMCSLYVHFLMCVLSRVQKMSISQMELWGTSFSYIEIKSLIYLVQCKDQIIHSLKVFCYALLLFPCVDGWIQSS